MIWSNSLILWITFLLSFVYCLGIIVVRGNKAPTSRAIIIFVNKFKRTMRAFTSSNVHKAVLTMLTKFHCCGICRAMTAKRSWELIAIDADY